MTPEEIRKLCELKYPQLRAEARSNPDGYSFFLGERRFGKDSNRILRAVGQSPRGTSRLKLVVSSRVEGIERDFSFSGSEGELSDLIENELALYQVHFSKP